MITVVAACRQGGGDTPIAPATTPAYAAAIAPWPPAVATAVIGRGASPVRPEPMSIEWGLTTASIVVDRVWAVPGSADALAIVSGRIGDRFAIEEIAVDQGRVRWRDDEACAAPVVHVTAERIICADALRTTGVDVATGQAKWSVPARFTGAEGELIVAQHGDNVMVISAGSGDVVSETLPPPGIPPDAVQRACETPAGLELWAWGDGGYARFAPGGGPETTPLAPGPSRVDACGTPPLVETPIPGSIERVLHVPGSQTTVTERGWWRGAGDHVIVATARGIEEHDAQLGFVRLISDAQVGREITARGHRRLVRGAGGTPVLLEDDKPIAWMSAPMRVDSAALGDGFVLGGGWQEPAHTADDHVDRWALPPAGAPEVAPLVIPDPPDPSLEARDLPPELDLTSAPSIDLAGVGVHDVDLAFLDRASPTMLYVAPIEQQPDATHGAGLAAFDLRARTWSWHVPDGCPAGTPISLARAGDVLVCGARGNGSGTGALRAVGADDGAMRWDWRGATVDALAGAGGIVVVSVGRVAIVLDAATGSELGRVAADDGFAPHVVPVDLGGVDAIVDVERGAVVARLPRAQMLPVWADAIRGVPTSLDRAGDHVTLELADGELYSIEPATGRAIAASGWARRWQPDGDLVLAGPAIPAGEAWPLIGYGVDGAPRFAASYALEPPWLVGVRGPDVAAPLPLAYGPAARAVTVVDAASGQVRARATLPRRTVPGAVFATVVDGHPLVGAVLSQPLGVLLLPP